MKVIFAASLVLALFGDIMASSYGYGHAPSYHHAAPSYHHEAPSYHHEAPAYHHEESYHSAPVGPSHSYSYPSPAPHVKCGSNLLVGCQPHAATVPCKSYHKSYSAPKY